MGIGDLSKKSKEKDLNLWDNAIGECIFEEVGEVSKDVFISFFSIFCLKLSDTLYPPDTYHLMKSINSQSF